MKQETWNAIGYVIIGAMLSNAVHLGISAIKGPADDPLREMYEDVVARYTESTMGWAQCEVSRADILTERRQTTLEEANAAWDALTAADIADDAITVVGLPADSITGPDEELAAKCLELPVEAFYDWNPAVAETVDANATQVGANVSAP